MKKLIVLFSLVCGLASAQTPTHKIISSFVPSSTPFMLVNQAIPELNKITGYEFRQESHPGAGTMIATNTFLASKEPNKLLIGQQNNLNILPITNPEVKHTKNDFRPIALLAQNYYCLVVFDKLKVNTFNELVELGKTKQLFYGTNAGVNGFEHILFQYVAVKYKMNLEAVHFKSAAEAQLATMRGDVSISFVPAVLCKKEIPNVVNLGYNSPLENHTVPNDLHVATYIAILGPKDMPDEENKKLADAFVTVWNKNREELSKLSILPRKVLTGKELEQFIDRQDAIWRNYYSTIQK
jgi:tripartite-type tricarboxylate transporter receptor subunit TctC